MTGGLKTYEVRYSITREEIYRVKAETAEDAQANAFEAGENVGLGETSNVSHIETNEVDDAERPDKSTSPPQRKKGDRTLNVG